MPGAAPGDPGGAQQRCSTTETPQQAQQVLCYELLNHHARLLMPALVQDPMIPSPDSSLVQDVGAKEPNRGLQALGHIPLQLKTGEPA